MRLPYSNLELRYRNPGASFPLVLSVAAIRNAPDEVVNENVRINSRNGHRWFEHIEPHDGMAIICGSGPSLADTVEDIKAHKRAGRHVFALNAAADFLASRGIWPDYQVMVDARECTADLVGPAKVHMFASQVHPKCFERKPDAILWHLQLDDIDDFLPPDSPPILTLIGGAASVGNCAVCLAYEMGYRNIHCYGYDSCHRGLESHALRQRINDDEPVVTVRFNGKEYLCSITMKLQAEKFQQTAYTLSQMGCKVSVHGTGLLPDMFNTPQEHLSEAEKYRRMFEFDDYRTFSPGERLVDLFMEKVKPEGLVIDFGCGTGRAALKIAESNPVLLLDITDNSREEKAKSLPFIVADLRESLAISPAAYGFCCDVLEHIPPEDVGVVVDNIMKAAEVVFFQISNVDDNFGMLIHQYLHLTVRPYAWWLKLFEKHGYTVSWSEDRNISSLFIVRRKVDSDA